MFQYLLIFGLRGLIVVFTLLSSKLEAISVLLIVVTDLNVLPTCEFSAVYAQPRVVKHYSGIYQVHASKVSPRDETWFKNWRRKDRGNPVISNVVSSEYKPILPPLLSLMS